VAEHLLIAGLICELSGVILLAKSLAFGSVGEYVVADAGEFGRSLLARDMSRARDMTDAGVGLLLIFVGILGQILDATHMDALEFGCWWYVIAGGVIVVALVLWRVVILLRQRQVVAHRLRSRPHAWFTTVDDYEQARREPGQNVGDVIAKGLGRKWFDDLVKELKADAARENPLPKPSGKASEVPQVDPEPTSDRAGETEPPTRP
jgi:hypothetical protein